MKSIPITYEDNGHRFIDLGLPSGTKWADCNIGASSPTDYGDCFAWGETSTKGYYFWDSYKYGRRFNVTKYCPESKYGKDGITDNKTELDLEDDVAHVQWGGQWRMPSIEQFEELVNHTTNRWANINDVIGRLFTASNGNSIFLPAAGRCTECRFHAVGSYGFYWSLTLDGLGNCAYGMFFNSDHVGTYYFGYRYHGHRVRAVHI